MIVCMSSDLNKWMSNQSNQSINVRLVGNLFVFGRNRLNRLVVITFKRVMFWGKTLWSSQQLLWKSRIDFCWVKKQFSKTRFAGSFSRAFKPSDAVRHQRRRANVRRVSDVSTGDQTPRTDRQTQLLLRVSASKRGLQALRISGRLCSPTARRSLHFQVRTHTCAVLLCCTVVSVVCCGVLWCARVCHSVQSTDSLTSFKWL